jgi:replicative DNA helicase
MKVSEAIELKFRNTDIEYRLAAYILRKSPGLSVAVQPEWFSVKLLGSLVAVSRKRREILTSSSSALHELRVAKVIRDKDKTPYDPVLKKVFDVPLDSVRDKDALLLARQVYELAESRRCLQGIQGIVTNIKDFDLRRAKSAMKDLSRMIEVHAEKLNGDYLADYEKRVEIIQEKINSPEEGKTIGIPTGFKRFDDLIGGVMPGEFGIVTGRSGIGKTATLLFLGTHAWSMGKSVLFCSGEMDKASIEFRMDSSLSGILGTKFRTGSLEEADWRMWQETVERLRLTHQGFFEVASFTRHFTSGEIESEVARIQDKWGKPVDLILIDYINIMDPMREIRNGDSQKSSSSQADVIWDVKQLAGEVNGGIVVWSAGQLTDEGLAAEQLELQHIKYSRSIGETAPIVVGLVQTEDDILENRIQWQVLKMRNADKLDRPLYLHPNLEVLRIHDDVVQNRDLLSLDDDVAPERAQKPQRRRRKSLDEVHE